ncbi:MAG: serine/threonine-protein phosphatase [Oscillospiraceae bacterium]|nr:serine/threonine-protein phosphatase [Oscillospiraceae bacterium]
MGGDFYDYFVVRDRWLCLAMCSGRQSGVSAAIDMTIIKTIIRSQMRLMRGLGETVTEINRQVALSLEGKNTDVGAFIGILDTADGTFRYVNADFPEPLLMRRDERYEWLKGPAYPALGSSDSVIYGDSVFSLGQGDRLVIFAGADVELTDSAGEAYGCERLRTHLNSSRPKGLSVEALVRSVENELDVWNDNRGADRDLTALALEYRKGSRESAQIVLAPAQAQSEQLLSFIKEQLAENGIVGKDYAQVAVLAEELFNICRNREAGEGDITMQCDVPPGTDSVTIRAIADMGGQDPLDELRTGPSRRAVEYIRKNCSSISFDSGDNSDVIILTKCL